MPGRIPRGRRARGFLLLEVLVALAVLALSLGVLLQSFSTGSRMVVTSGHYNRAGELAQSRLARVGLDVPLRPAVLQGRDGAYAWRLEIAPWAEVAPGAGLLPYDVTVTVTWNEDGRTRQRRLATLRLGPAEA